MQSAKHVNADGFICADHFDEVMFANNLKNRLHQHAVPTIWESTAVATELKGNSQLNGQVDNSGMNHSMYNIYYYV